MVPHSMAGRVLGGRLSIDRSWDVHAIRSDVGVICVKPLVSSNGSAPKGTQHYCTGYLLLGLVTFATVTGLYFWLDVPLVAAAFTYLFVLVLLSLVSSLSSLIVLSFVAVGCLSYFFAPPIYSFRVDSPQDIITISAFVITSFVVNFLVTRVRDANQRLEVTNKALRIENVERKRAEQAQRESEDKFRQIMDTVLGRPSTGSEGNKAEIQPG